MCDGSEKLSLQKKESEKSEEDEGSSAVTLVVLTAAHEPEKSCAISLSVVPSVFHYSFSLSQATMLFYKHSFICTHI